tara:strand:+ start:43 stop:291 length:249 start_codon:yes stop_codon:yes gene_type:complete
MVSRATRFHEEGKSSGLKKNPKTGEIVSIKKSVAAKKAANPLAMWRKALKKAGAYEKGEFTVIKKGTPVYNKAKAIYEQMKK